MTTAEQDAESELLTLHEVAEELDLSVRHVHDLIEAGTLPAVRTGRTVLVRRADVVLL